MHCLSLILVACAMFLCPVEAGAYEFRGVFFPDAEMIEEVKCPLVGCRTSTRLFFTICVGALYMEHPVYTAEKIIRADEHKRVVIHFLFPKVRAADIAKDIEEGFQEVGIDTDGPLRESIARYKGCFPEPMRRGDRIEVTYRPGSGTEVWVKGERRGVIEDREFMVALFTVWFMCKKKEHTIMVRKVSAHTVIEPGEYA